jgi:hypothetical protein
MKTIFNSLTTIKPHEKFFGFSAGKSPVAQVLGIMPQVLSESMAISLS